MINKSFTLIEVLVVVTIIGIMSSLVMTAISGAKAKARDARRIQELHSIQKALHMYEIEPGHFPAGEKYQDGVCINDDDDLVNALTPYLPEIPREPLSGRMCFAYISDAAGSGYKIMADLERNVQMEMNDGGVYDDLYELFTDNFSASTLGSNFAYAGGYQGGSAGAGAGVGGGDFSLKFEGTNKPAGKAPQPDFVDVGQAAANPILPESPSEYTLEVWVKLEKAQSDFEPLSEINKRICNPTTGFCDAKGASIAIGGTEPAVYHAYWKDIDEPPDGIDDISQYEIIKSGVNISLNQWHFIVATYGRNIVGDYEVKIYVDPADGLPKGTKEVPGHFALDPDSNFFIGSFSQWSDEEAPDFGLDGVSIDNVRIYDYAIDRPAYADKELVKKHFEGDYSDEYGLIPLPGKVPPAVGHWPFEEGSGDETADVSGKNPPAKLKPADGGPTWQPN